MRSSLAKALGYIPIVGEGQGFNSWLEHICGGFSLGGGETRGGERFMPLGRRLNADPVFHGLVPTKIAGSKKKLFH